MRTHYLQHVGTEKYSPILLLASSVPTMLGAYPERGCRSYEENTRLSDVSCEKKKVHGEVHVLYTVECLSMFRATSYELVFGKAANFVSPTSSNSANGCSYR